MKIKCTYCLRIYCRKLDDESWHNGTITIFLILVLNCSNKLESKLYFIQPAISLLAYGLFQSTLEVS